jgi:hypothetical protein
MSLMQRLTFEPGRSPRADVDLRHADTEVIGSKYEHAHAIKNVQ